MYSKRYRCDVEYFVVQPGKEIRWIPHRALLNRAKQTGHIYNRDTLPRFHAWMCNELRQRLVNASLRGQVSCSLNNSPYVDLLDTDVDLCTAPNHGVLDP